MAYATNLAPCMARKQNLYKSAALLDIIIFGMLWSQSFRKINMLSETHKDYCGRNGFGLCATSTRDAAIMNDGRSVLFAYILSRIGSFPSLIVSLVD